MNADRIYFPLLGELRYVPDPWSEDIRVAVNAVDAVPLCVNCLGPQDGHRWFCQNCGFPSGEYVTVMPYLYVFSLGECLQRGVRGEPEKNARVSGGFVMLSLAQYLIFAPVYWFWMYRKARGRPIGPRLDHPLRFEE